MIIDRYLKTVLTIIALSLMIIAISHLIDFANASMSGVDYHMINNRLGEIASAIRGCN